MATPQQPQENDHDDDDYFYKMNAIPRGLCIIINNENFGTEMETRSGSDIDRDNLRETFDWLKLDVTVHNNLTDVEMINVMKDVSTQDHSQYDCLVVCILTHGCEGIVYGTNGKEVPIKDMTNYVKPLHCATLVGKPKLFFIQACQGRGKQTLHVLEPDTTPTEEEKLTPSESDMLLSYSTVPGYLSFRDKTSGSIFINCLTSCLRKYAHRENILDILTKVNRDVCNTRVQLTDGGKETLVGQCPGPQFTLRKKVILGSGIEHAGLGPSFEPLLVNLRDAEGDACVERRDMKSVPPSDDAIVRRPTSTIDDSRRWVQYVVTVTTDEDKSVPGVFVIKLFGIRGITQDLELKNGTIQNKALMFEERILDVAPLKMLRVAFISEKGKNKPHLNKIELRNRATRTVTVFHHNELLGSDPVYIAAMERDKRLLEERDYKVTVETSDCLGAGTDANVYIILFGSNGESRVLHLEKSENFKDPFEKGHSDVFVVSKLLNLGELFKLRVWHDNKHMGAAWHLAKIEVKDMKTQRAYLFKCDRWLSKKQGDGQILRELVCSSAAGPDTIEYEIEVKTADEAGSGTCHGFWVMLKGSKCTSNAILLHNNAQHKILQRGETDNFTHECTSYGSLQSCIIGCYESKLQPLKEHDRASDWLCHHVVVTDTGSGVRTMFPCDQWLSPKKHAVPNGVECGKGSEEFTYWAKAKEKGVVIYELSVRTGDRPHAGTDANVFITIFSDSGDTGKRHLTKPGRDLFERGRTDTFSVEAVELGVLTSILIEHDQAGFGPDWFLDQVEITNKKTNTKTTFPCRKWLTGKAGETSVVLRPEPPCRPSA